MRRLTVLGATGSIGRSTLEVVARHSTHFDVFALTAAERSDLLFEQCLRFRPKYAVIVNKQKAQSLQRALKEAGLSTEVLAGAKALQEVAADASVDTVMAAIVGAAGLEPTMAAAYTGKRVLLANKEALVVAGPLLAEAISKSGGQLLPIDSEHNALFQVLPREGLKKPKPSFAGYGVRRLILTASGGPFLNTAAEELPFVTVETACAHPTWSMGRKISVDSATMMNKGLEVIEAHSLFNIPVHQIEVVLHPQSVVHSMVDYVDGSVLAQMANADMRTPIAYALDYPNRLALEPEACLDFSRLPPLTFLPPDPNRFPCLQLAYDALQEGGCATAVLNAANEEAVSAFLSRRLKFTDIPVVIAETLAAYSPSAGTTVEALMAIDTEARAYAKATLHRLEKADPFKSS